MSAVTQAYVAGFIKRAKERGLLAPALSNMVPGVGPAIYGAATTPHDRVGGALRGFGGGALGSIPGVAVMNTGNLLGAWRHAMPTAHGASKAVARIRPGIARNTSVAGLLLALLGGGLGARRAVHGPAKHRD